MIKRILVFLVRLLALIVISFLLYAWWVSVQAETYQTELGPQLQKKFGFRTGSPIVRAGTESVEVFSIHPEIGGLFEKIGFEEGDIVISTSITGFYKALYTATGELEFEVIPGGDGIALEKRKKRTIRLPVGKTETPTN